MKKYLLILLLLTACVSDPEAPIYEPIDYGSHGAYILNEGIWGQGNATLSRYDLAQNQIRNNVISMSNDGYELGDLANDIIKLDTTFLVVMSSTRSIYEVEISSAKLLRTIILGSNRLPRRIALANDSIAYISDLYTQSIFKFNYKSFRIYDDKILTGPAPEGIAYYKNKVFVCNSGYGDYLAKEPKAGTVSVIDENTLNEIDLLEDMPNTTEIIVNPKTDKIYVSYLNLPSLEDSLGGIVEFDAGSLKETRRWRIDPVDIQLDTVNNHLYYLDYGLYKLDLNDYFAKPELIIKNADTTNHWYSFAINPIDGNYWICDAKNYAINGELLIFDKYNPHALLFRKPIGVNPGKILFY
jgi:hypothetical protein